MSIKKFALLFSLYREHKAIFGTNQVKFVEEILQKNLLVPFLKTLSDL